MSLQWALYSWNSSPLPVVTVLWHLLQLYLCPISVQMPVEAKILGQNQVALAIITSHCQISGLFQL